MTKYFVSIRDRTHEVEITGDVVRLDGAVVEADLHGLQGSDVWSLLLEGSSYRVVATSRDRGEWSMRIGGESFRARVVDERQHHIEEMTGTGAGPAGPAPMRAPMPGMIVRVEVGEGDRVEPGQGLVIVEAMKMENELTAETSARVARIHVAEGQAVEKDEVLIDLEPLQEGAEP